MTIEHLPHSADSPPNSTFGGPGAPYGRELRTRADRTSAHGNPAARGARPRRGLLRQKDELIQQQELFSKESDHRLLNDLQMIVSLLSLQSRASANAEAASQLAAAADRIATIGRIHRRLHYCDGVQTVAFKQFLEDLCRDFSSMLSSDQRPERDIVVEGIEVKLPTVTAIPLGFIVNELITNAAKYGKGRITVRLEPNPERATRCRSPMKARICQKDLIQPPVKDSG